MIDKIQIGDEEIRIKKAGGEISMSRVEGKLSVARGFGDFDYKVFLIIFINFKLNI